MHFCKTGNVKPEEDISYNKTPYSPGYTIVSVAKLRTQFFEGFGIGAGVSHIGKTYQNQFNKQFLPAYTLVNGVAYYQFKSIEIELQCEFI